MYDTRDCLVSTRISTFAGIRRIAEKTDSVVRYYHTDHLGSTRLMTDSQGSIVAEYKYYPYGANLAQSILDPSFDGATYRFTGKGDSPNTGLYYFGARSYDPEIGRFIALDPARDGLNWYEYCGSNPFVYVDPSGMKAWLVHGTWSSRDRAWSEVFIDYLEDVFDDEEVKTYDWSGRNNKGARVEGAEKMAKVILDWHTANPDDPIRLVGHSHGGNVSILAANILYEEYGITVDTLITIATPVREYRLNHDVGQHINVYNTKDIVQVYGGPFLRAGRTFKDAENIRVDLPIWRWHPVFQVHNHLSMHRNINTWKEYIEPRLEK